jgi:glycosyltransferase involved in cell wall biosynthesis
VSNSVSILHIGESIKGGIASYLKTLEAGLSEDLLMDYLLPLEHMSDSFKSKGEMSFFCGRGRIQRLFCLFYSLIVCVNVKSYDVIHVHSTGAGLVCWIYFKIFSKRSILIYSSHGWSGLRGKDSRAKLIDRIIPGIFDLVIDISENEKRYSKVELGLPECKIRMIYNGSAIETVSKFEIEAVSRDKNEIRLLFVGRLDEQKGHDVAVKSFNLVSHLNIEFDIVGEAVVDLGSDTCSSGIKYHGWLDAEDLKVLYKAADYLVMPSRWEGFGLVAIEAMSCGLPVLHSNRGALGEVIGNADLMFDFDESGLNLAALISSLDNPSLDLRLRCVDRVRKELSCELFWEKMRGVYEEASSKSKTIGQE